MDVPKYIYKRTNHVILIIFAPLFVLVFLGLFRPFGLNAVDESFFASLNVSYWTFMVSIILVAVIIVTVSRIVMNLYTHDNDISVLAYFLWCFMEFIIIAVFYTIFTLIIGTSKDVLTVFFNSFSKTTVLMIIPYCLCYGYFVFAEKVRQLSDMNKKMKILEEAQLSAYIPINDEKGEMKISVRREDLLLLESADNYVCVWYLSSGTIKKTMIRNTMKKLEDLLSSDKHVVRCHRSYMVNLDHIKVLRREKEGFFIELGHENVPEIPISSKYVETISSWLYATTMKPQ